jgi:hypothetical protein
MDTWTPDPGHQYGRIEIRDGPMSRAGGTVRKRLHAVRIYTRKPVYGSPGSYVGAWRHCAGKPQIDPLWMDPRLLDHKQMEEDEEGGFRRDGRMAFGEYWLTRWLQRNANSPLRK